MDRKLIVDTVHLTVDTVVLDIDMWDTEMKKNEANYLKRSLLSLLLHSDPYDGHRDTVGRSDLNRSHWLCRLEEDNGTLDIRDDHIFDRSCMTRMDNL